MFIRILNSEMELATGCTEPGAVALTAAEAGQALRKAGVDKAEEITVNASINIIKNAMSAGIPGTDYEGMDYAAAIGALGGDPVYLLEVMNYVPRETVEAAAALVKAGKVRVNVAQVPQKLYIEVIAKGGGHTGRAIVRDLHTNVVLVEQDGVATLDKRDTDTAAAGDSDVVSPEQIASFLTVRSIWDYCTKELDPMNDPIDIIRSAVKVNSVISDEGLSKEYGLAIGRNLDLNCRKGLMTRDLTTNSMIAAAAGADRAGAAGPAGRCGVRIMRHAANTDRGTDPMRAPPPRLAVRHVPVGDHLPCSSAPGTGAGRRPGSLTPCFGLRRAGGAGSKAAFPRCAALPAGRCPRRGVAAVAGAGPAKRRGCGV